MSQAFRICLLIPTYNNPRTIASVVESGRRYLDDVIIVDDGSGPECRAVCEKLAQEGRAVVHHRQHNGGKGAAIKDGFRIARELGCSHVLQVDADGQHDLSLIPRFVQLAKERPEALIVGSPSYDGTAPRLRLSARKITKFWVDLEAGAGVIKDAMIGFRVYPLGPLSTVRVGGDRMGFDIEICVRAAWAGVPICNEPVPVRYLTQDEGGISHFRPFWDNLEFAWLHTRLTTWRCFSLLFRFRPAPAAGPALLPVAPVPTALAAPSLTDPGVEQSS